jgi:GNAT superfamily N-acetyltransferase
MFVPIPVHQDVHPANTWLACPAVHEHYAGLDLRTLCSPLQVLGPSRHAALDELYDLVVRTFEGTPPRDRLEQHLDDSDIAAVASDGTRLVGASLAREFSLASAPGSRVFFLQAAFIDPMYRRTGLASRLTYSATDAALAQDFGVRGLRRTPITFVTRTQNPATVSVFYRWFDGTAQLGQRLLPVHQAAIDCVAKSYGWVLDAHNVQHGAYDHALSGKRLQNLGEKDAVLLAGTYTWRHHLLARAMFAGVYPVRHWLANLATGGHERPGNHAAGQRPRHQLPGRRSRQARGSDLDPPPPTPGVTPSPPAGSP